MSYEKKYKEALERASKLRVQNPFDTVGQMVEHIFPELQESEEERIRKELIEFLKLPHSRFVGNREHEKWIAWLEKQREQKHTAIDIDKMVGEFAHTEVKGYGIPSLIEVDAYRKGISDAVNLIFGIEKQGEKDPCIGCTNDKGCVTCENGNLKEIKVEPKFKVGDFIVSDICCGKVIEVTDYAYLLDTGQGLPFTYDYRAHIWTINDAKDGDILCYETDELEWILIFKDIIPASSVAPHDLLRYHAFLSDNEVYGSDVIAMISDDADYYFSPATKEQRDMLFNKLREAGAKWDSEKKQLKYIEL